VGPGEWVRFPPAALIFKMELTNAKGVRDLSPQEKILKQKVIDTIRTVYENFGYSPLETPIIERYDILASKYAGGSEILKETFTLKDQGGRDLCLRYDLTVPFARYVGMNKNIKFPFKRYQIGRAFRDGPIKKGRSREFWQCDADVVGTKSMMADAECLIIARQVFSKLGLEVNILVNNRKILNGILRSCNVEESKQESVILTIDKIKKVREEGVIEELETKNISKESITKLMEILKKNVGENNEKLEYLKTIIIDEEGGEGLNEMKEVLSYAEARFDFSLARGLSYYTSTVFEFYLQDKSKVNVSLGSGGRYDNMIGNFLGNQQVPAVGVSFGLEPISLALDGGTRKSVVDYYVIPINTEKECFALVQELRAQGLNVDMDFQGRGISKNLAYANSYEIPNVLFVGPEELKQNRLKLKNMKTGEERLVSRNELISK
jgi:histidyl-tRNA synthetase